MSSAFSWFVIVGTIGSIIFFFLVLQLNSSVDNVGETTGHSYDGIEEYDNPLPAWWYWKFILTIIFGLGYLTYYPGLGNFEGLSGWTKIGELEVEQKIADERYGPIFAAYRDIPVEQLARDDSANKMGKRMFINNCSVCHGATGQGSFGFPNLTDSEWMWGSEGGQIETTILNGRNGVMMPWKDILVDDGVAEVTEYVLSLAGREVDASLAAKGAVHYASFCAACHGSDGTGSALFGAPDLTNEIWLYGNSKGRIAHVIKNGRNGVMPAFKEKLGEDKVHILAAYVKSLRQG